MRIRALFLGGALAALSAGASAALSSEATPDSVALGSPTAFEHFQAVLSEDGVPVTGAAYRFETDPSCALFEDGAASADGITDAYGQALAPRLLGLALTLECRTLLYVEGYAEPLDLSVHVFDPAAVVLTAVTAQVDTWVNADPWSMFQFPVEIEFHADGLPVNAWPLEAAITTSPSGATATLVTIRSLINSGTATIWIQPNEKQGHYEVIASYRGVSVDIPVTQRARRPH